MITGSLARRYAKAIFSIGVDGGTYEAIGREVASLAAAMRSSDELTDALCNPIFKRAQRRKLLERMLVRIGASAATRKFFLLLLDRERMSAVPDIARELTAMIDDKAGRINALVTSARALSPIQIQQLKQALEKVSGKQVQLEHREDPNLLGGVVAQLGDIEYDGSLRTQLDRIRESLAS